MSESNVDIVKRLYAAMATRDIPGVIKLVDSGLTIEQSADLPWGGQYKGLLGLQQFVSRLTGAIDSVATPDRFVSAGEQVVAIGQTRGTAKATSKPFDVPFVHVWTGSGGKVTRLQAYIEHASMLGALSPA